MASRDLPDQASVVIIGGGVIGLSTAYHLAGPGCATSSWSSGTSSAPARPARRPAACAPSSRTRSTSSSGLRSLRAFESFEETFGQEIDLHQVGYLFLLDRPEHVRRSRRTSRCRTSWACPAG